MPKAPAKPKAKAKRRALGRGLKDLIPDLEELGQRPQIQLGVEQLVPLKMGQPRQQPGAGLDELVASVKEQGVLQPLWVRRRGKQYEIIAGERRWRAAQKAGRGEVPAIEFRGLDDDEVLVLSLVENLQRSDLNPLDEAETYRRLADSFGLTQEAIAARIGKQRATVANTVRLLDLPVEVQEMVRRGTLSAGHARALLGLKEPKEIVAAARAAVREGASVRDVERQVARGRKRRPGRRTGGKVKPSAQQKAVIEKLQRSLGARVTLVDKAGRGRIEIQYSSAAERERLIAVLLGGR